MLFSIKKNANNTWSLTPTSGVFQGLVIGEADGVDLVSVTVSPDRATGTLKAVWGLNLDQSIDVFSDVETTRALRLGHAFKGYAEHAVRWASDGIYDIDSSRMLRRCQRLVALGSHLYRR